MCVVLNTFFSILTTTTLVLMKPLFFSSTHALDHYNATWNYHVFVNDMGVHRVGMGVWTMYVRVVWWMGGGQWGDKSRQCELSEVDIRTLEGVRVGRWDGRWLQVSSVGGEPKWCSHVDWDSLSLPIITISVAITQLIIFIT